MKNDINAVILELLASKICHDLISPIGAVNNGIEILEEMGAEAGPDVTQLIAFSAAQASAKLKAYRMAYGIGGADANLRPDDVHKTLAALLDGDAKIKQDWNAGALKLDEYPKAYCKILICLFLLAVECLPKGGTISASLAANGETLVRGQGPAGVLKDAMEDALAGKTPPEQVDTRNTHAFITGLVAAHHGFKIAVAEKTDTAIAFSFRKNAA